MPYKQQTRREIWKVTEYRDGCVYDTQSLGLVWVDLDEVCGQRDSETWEQYRERTANYEKRIAKECGGDFLGFVSTGLPFEETFRSVKE